MALSTGVCNTARGRAVATAAVASASRTSATGTQRRRRRRGTRPASRSRFVKTTACRAARRSARSRITSTTGTTTSAERARGAPKLITRVCAEDAESATTIGGPSRARGRSRRPVDHAGHERQGVEKIRLRAELEVGLEAGGAVGASVQHGDPVPAAADHRGSPSSGRSALASSISRQQSSRRSRRKRLGDRRGGSNDVDDDRPTRAAASFGRCESHVDGHRGYASSHGGSGTALLLPASRPGDRSLVLGMRTPDLLRVHDPRRRRAPLPGALRQAAGRAAGRDRRGADDDPRRRAAGRDRDDGADRAQRAGLLRRARDRRLGQRHRQLDLRPRRRSSRTALRRTASRPVWRTATGGG